MRHTYLDRLQASARSALVGALLLVLVVPLYQFAVLQPTGYGNALSTTGQTLRWIASHILAFVGYRALLIIGFFLLLRVPLALFRVIIAQEILGREDENEDEGDESDDENEDKEIEKNDAGGMPDYAWRGQGFALLAAWSGLLGLVLFPLATLASTLYLLIVSSSTSAPLIDLFAVLTFTVAGGLIALSCLFFGAVITRSGRRLWPDSWLVFGYASLALAVLLSASAVEVALDPGAGQAVLSTPAILLFGLWTFWFGIMILRLKPE